VRRYVIRTLSGVIHPALGTLGSRFAFSLAREKINRLLFLTAIAYFISPIAFLMLFSFTAFRYFTHIYEVFFFSKEAKAKYEQMLRPVTDETIAVSVGYRVYPEELEDHLRLVTSNKKEDMKELAKKGKQMRTLAYRQFGWNFDRMCRHNVFLGTTGSGKTETIMSLFTDVVKAYAGLGLVDGKSDQAMQFKIYNLCKENYYETQFNAIVLNKPELMTESNTYSPLLSFQSATKTSEFLGDFLGGEGGGNADYFANRGKVMLGNIVMYFKNRQIYYKENFSINDLSGSIEVTEINSIYFMAYAIISELEFLITDAIEKDHSFKKMMSKARLVKTTQNEEIKNCEILVEYLNQNSHLTRKVERVLGIKYGFFSDHYELFTSLNSYIFGVYPLWGKYARAVAKVLFLYGKKYEKVNFLYTHSDPAKITFMRSAYNRLKNNESEEFMNTESLVVMQEKEYKQIGAPLSIQLNAIDFNTFKEAMGLAETAETIEQMNMDALQQHSYAVQQWSRVFGLYKQYLRVFGTPNPDVDGEDLLKNCKVLYVMLPVMELSPDQVEMLGKMFILMFKMIASIALGGDKQSATPIQFRIYQNKIKPNPIFLMVLDELGSYMPAGGQSGLVSILLSQVRSLRIGMMLSVQDTVSLNPPSNQNELKRIRANLSKIILQHKDEDTKDLESIIPEVEMIESEGHIRSAISEKLLDSGRVKIEKRKTIDLGLATRFSKGMGMYIDGGRDEPIFFQSYYLGDNSKQAAQIRRYESFESLHRE